MLRITGLVIASLLVLLVIAAAWFARPLGRDDLKATPQPAAGYDEAFARIEAVHDAEDQMDLQAVGHSISLLHESRTETAVVIFHGFTDVPDQFSKIAQAYYDAGANVWIPRLPFHGYVDRMTDDPSKITAQLLSDFADDNVDIASGLGRNVEVVGLSGGGAITIWVAAERPDVDRAVVLSPLVLPKGYKPWMVRPAARIVAALPDSYTWWTENEDAEPPPEYPRYSRHGITAFLMLVERAKYDGRGNARPVKGDVVMVSNLNDQHLDTAYPIEVMKPLIAEECSLTPVTIPASYQLKHDLVGKGENGQDLRTSYRYLSTAIGMPLPDPYGD